MSSIVIHPWRDEAGPALQGELEGMPEGVVIPKGYLSHQIWRIRRCVDPSARTPTGPDVVALSGGIRDQRTAGNPILVTVRSSGLGPRFARPLQRAFHGTIRGLAFPVACLTAVRKVLEDRSIFVGSRVLALAAQDEDSTTKDLLAASCGAYKVTEQADRTKDRIIRSATKAAATIQARVPVQAFELLASGPLGWTGTTRAQGRALEARLAGRILTLSVVGSVTTEVSVAADRGISALRLRCVLKRSNAASKASAARAALASVLSETVIIGELFEYVTGQRLVAPAEITRLGLKGRGTRPIRL